MVLLAVESLTWPQILLVTGLGFGIVVALLCVLVYILKGLGWTMQKTTAPKAPKAPKAEKQPEAPKASAPSAEPADEGTKAAIAMTLASADDDDIAAVAYALYLAKEDGKHDIPTAMISLKAHETAWNTKSIGLNNQGF